MKYLVLILFGFAVLISRPALAEEIIMICKKDGVTEIGIYKYINPIFGSKQVQQRVDGEWVKWGRDRSDDFVTEKVKINNRSAVLNRVKKKAAITQQGEEYIYHERYVLDFEFLTRKYENYFAKLDGTPFQARDKAHSRSCKAYDLSSSSEKK